MALKVLISVVCLFIVYFLTTENFPSPVARKSVGEIFRSVVKGLQEAHNHTWRMSARRRKEVEHSH